MYKCLWQRNSTDKDANRCESWSTSGEHDVFSRRKMTRTNKYTTFKKKCLKHFKFVTVSSLHFELFQPPQENAKNRVALYWFSFSSAILCRQSLFYWNYSLAPYWKVIKRVKFKIPNLFLLKKKKNEESRKTSVTNGAITNNFELFFFVSGCRCCDGSSHQNQPI